MQVSTTQRAPIGITLRRMRPFLVPACAAAGVLLLLRNLDLHRLGMELRYADLRWLMVAEVLSALSVIAGALTWGLLVRCADHPLTWRQIGAWSGRAVLFGQVIPGGAGGDAVRLLAARHSGRGTAVASVLVARLCGCLGIATWGMGGALLLRDAVGPVILGAAVAFFAVAVGSLAVVLNADRLLTPLAGRSSRWASRMRAALCPSARMLASYRRRPGLMVQAALLGIAGWGLNLAALVSLARVLDIGVGWQVFAAAVPVALAATLIPLSPNGVGVKEGILAGLLMRSGVAVGSAAALTVLIDMQLIPIALIGALAGLRVPRPEEHTPVREVPAALEVPGPALAPVHVHPH